MARFIALVIRLNFDDSYTNWFAADFIHEFVAEQMLGGCLRRYLEPGKGFLVHTTIIPYGCNSIIDT